jgi:hypothetical protein
LNLTLHLHSTLLSRSRQIDVSVAVHPSRAAIGIPRQSVCASPSAANLPFGRLAATQPIRYPSAASLANPIGIVRI